MKNTFGQSVSVTVFGESHGQAIGAVLDGMAAGVPVDEALLCRAADALAAHEELPMQAAELAAAVYCFGEAGCTLAVVELPDAGLAAVLPKMPVCAVTAVGPDGVSRSVERLAALAGWS